MVEKIDELESLKHSLSLSGVPNSTLDVLEEVYEEQPAAVIQIAELLRGGWTIDVSGTQAISIILRSKNADYEVRGYGASKLDAFEELQRKTRNFTPCFYLFFPSETTTQNAES